jgi:hypothetical protein
MDTDLTQKKDRGYQELLANGTMELNARGGALSLNAQAKDYSFGETRKKLVENAKGFSASTGQGYQAIPIADENMAPVTKPSFFASSAAVDDEIAPSRTSVRYDWTSETASFRI